ncbi:MAG: aminotransferase class I/II-fold pyridoxal phosphate-dependent enzyme, partial [Pseudonocardiaceae bacterium]
MKTSARLDRLPPYLFAELERKIAAKKAAGVDVISLGIGDPDTPTPELAIEALAEAAADPGTHRYPSNRGRPELREAIARFYDRRFGVALDPEGEIVPALGAKEAIFNLNLAFLDPGTVALAADPGYPVYTGGPLLAGGEVELMPLLPERGFTPDLLAIPADVLERARLMYLNYPNNPTGVVVPAGFFDEVVAFAQKHDFLVVHDASYTETTFDGYVAPSFLETPGARDVGIEVFSLSKGYNMTGWRTAAVVGNAEAVEAYWKLKTNVDSGMFEAVQLAAATALDEGD